MFTRSGKMRSDPSKKYGCNIVVSEASKSQTQEKRRPIYLRQPNKDERRQAGGLGKAKPWQKIVESRIKTNMKSLKPESRIIKHNVEKSQQLISDESQQHSKPADFHAETKICQVDGVPVQFGSANSTLERKDEFQDVKPTEEAPGLRSPEFVGQGIVYHVFYQDNPMDVIESLLVTQSSNDPTQNAVIDSDKRLVEQDIRRGSYLGEAGKLSTEASAVPVHNMEANTGLEDVSSEKISEDIRVDLSTDQEKPSVEVTPRRNVVQTTWSTLPTATRSQDNRIRSLALARVGSKSSDKTSARLRDNLEVGQLFGTKETTISWNITSPEAEDMEQSLLQLLNARLQLLSSQKLRYLLGVMDRLERNGASPHALQNENPIRTGEEGNTVSLRILSNWGDATSVGLVEVDFFDIEGKKIDIEPTHVGFSRQDLDSTTLSRIVDGVVQSGDENNLWETSLPSENSWPLEICIRLPFEASTVGHLEVWNHNLSGAKGVKDLQVLLNGELVWEGTVSKSSGNPFFDSFTRISLLEELPVSTAALTPHSTKSDVDEDDDYFEVTRQVEHAEDSAFAAKAQERKGTADEKVENDSLWSLSFRQGTQEEDGQNETKTDFEFEEIEMFIESGEFINDETSHRDPSANLEAGASYEIFDMLDESTDERTLFQACDQGEHDAETGNSPGVEAEGGLQAFADFYIPLLPRGSKLTINIDSTWGDPHYVGLSGIEIFDESGNLLLINARRQIQVNFTSSAILSGLYCTPCPIERLVDNVNLTCDDSHMWLAPFSAGNSCSINISFQQVTTLGAVRFWNYNKSATHSYRGARLICMFLDSTLIFFGELRQASGSLSDGFSNAEPILFTENETTLSAIEHHDLQKYKASGNEEGFQDASPEEFVDAPAQDLLFKLPVPSSQAKRVDETVLEHSALDKAPVGCLLRLNLLRSWGDCYYFGLTGIQVLDENGNAHTIQSELITAKPRDLNDIPGHTGDYRTLDKLVDGCNVTTDDRHMWLVPYDGPEAEHYMEITFKSPITMAALKIWNYNKSLDDTFRGIKWIQVLVDEVEVSPPGGYLIRKAPGTHKLDFGQVIPLSKKAKRNLYHVEMNNAREKAKLRRLHSEIVQQEYLTPLLPFGHIIKFVLLSTWGDHQYLGLNGIELYDQSGHLVPVLKHNVHVVPDMSTHFSNPEKLFNGVNNTWDTQNMWLSVRDYSEGNHIYVYFNGPVMLSCIKLWNYGRNPTFGVREMEIFLDDLLIYKGYVRKAISANSRHLVDGHSFPQSILFSNDEEMLLANEDNVFYCGGIPNSDIILINDNYVVSDGQPSTTTL